MLSLETQAVTPPKTLARLLNGAVPRQEIAGVELEPRFRGAHRQPPSAGSTAQFRSKPELPWIPSNDPIVIVATGQQHLLVARIDPFTDASRRPKIECGIIDSANLACWDGAGVGG